MRVRLEFKLQDLWVGAYWRPGHLWVCLLPCLPLHFQRNVGPPQWMECFDDEMAQAVNEEPDDG